MLKEILRKFFKIISALVAVAAIIIFICSCFFIYKARAKYNKLYTPIITLNGSETEPVKVTYEGKAPAHDNTFTFDYVWWEDEEHADIKVETADHSYYFCKVDDSNKYQTKFPKTNATITVLKPFTGEVNLYDAACGCEIMGMRFVGYGGVFLGIIMFICSVPVFFSCSNKKQEPGIIPETDE